MKPKGYIKNKIYVNPSKESYVTTKIDVFCIDCSGVGTYQTGMITDQKQNVYKFIVVIIEYFSKIGCTVP